MKTLILTLMCACGGVETATTFDGGLEPVVRAEPLPCPCADEGRQEHLIDGHNTLVICAPVCSPADKPFSPNTPSCESIGLKVDVTGCRLLTPAELGL